MPLRHHIWEYGRGPGTHASEGSISDPGGDLMATQTISTIPRVSVGTDAKRIGAVYLPVGTFALRALLGTLDGTVTATLEIRTLAAAVLATVTGSGDVAAVGPSNFYNGTARWLQVYVYTNNAGGSAVVEGASLETV